MVLPGSVRSRLPADTPERVVRLVEEMLRRRELGSSQSAPPGGKGKKQSQPSHNVQLNIWDFAGRSLYYITHQVALCVVMLYLVRTRLYSNDMMVYMYRNTPICVQPYVAIYLQCRSTSGSDVPFGVTPTSV